MFVFFFYNRGSKVLAQDAQKDGGCHVSGDIQNQSGWGFEQPDVALGIPVHCRGVGLDGLWSLPTHKVL